MAVALLVAGHWMITVIVSFTQDIFAQIPPLLEAAGADLCGPLRDSFVRLGGGPRMGVTWLGLASGMLAGVRMVAFLVVAPPFSHNCHPGCGSRPCWAGPGAGRLAAGGLDL